MNATTFMLGASERAEIGHITQWTRLAREMYALVCDLVERNPAATITITVSAK